MGIFRKRWGGRFKLVLPRTIVMYDYRHGLDSKEIKIRAGEYVLILMKCPLKPPFKSKKEWGPWLVMNQTSIGLSQVALELEVSNLHPFGASLKEIEE